MIRPFAPAEDEPEFATECTRAQRIADRILALDPANVRAELHGIVASLSDHHRDVERVLMRRFHDINGLSIAAASVTDDQARLIGGYFSEEYAFEAAALF
ncbi:MAG: glycosidase, partial [Sphingobium sp.]